MKRPLIVAALIAAVILAFVATRALTPEPRRIVALGDSYSSGDGAPPYEDATFGTRGGCRRSGEAWPRQLGVTQEDLLACSGARLNDITQQAATIPAGAQVITLTGGGNDLGFASLLLSCFMSECIDSRQTALDAAAALSAPLTELLRTLRAEHPNAQIVLVGYPRLTPRTDAELAGCAWLTPAEREAVASISAALNATQAQAAKTAGVTFADVSQALAGHELCTADSWFVPVGLTPTGGQAHPAPAGQKALADAVKAVLNR